jgi:hypothetical protein
MMQLDEAFYIRVKNQTEELLFRIPGVRGVALGPKIVGGALTDTPAIQVFVARKRPLHDLAADEQIPREINGIYTDIIELPSLPVVANGTEQPCRSGTITKVAVVSNNGSDDSPVVITSPGHGLAMGNIVRVFGVPLNQSIAFPVNVQNADTFTIPDLIKLVQEELPIQSFAFWRMTCAWENDLCGSPSGQITDATSTNPVVITSPAHGLHSGDRIKVVRITGMREILGKEYTVASKDGDHFELRGVDGSLFTMAAHESGEWAKLCIDRSGPIERVTLGSPIQLTAPGHTLKKGDRVHIIHNKGAQKGVVDPTAIPEITSWNKGEPFKVDTVTDNTFTLEGVTRTGGSGDTAVRGAWIRILPDDRTYSRMQGGIRIALDSQEIHEEPPNADAGRSSAPLVTKVGISHEFSFQEKLTYGTLGCIAIDNEMPNAKVLLSNYHVLYSLDEEDVHHPTYSSCKSHKIAKRVRHADPGESGRLGTVDAAIAKLDGDVKSDPMIVDIGPVKGTATIGLQDILVSVPSGGTEVLGYRVRKRGVTTLLTEGIVTSIGATFQNSDQNSESIFIRDQIVVQPMAGPYYGAFVLKGDSGSAVVNDQEMVVGLVVGGDETGQGYVSPIKEIEDQLNVHVWAADSPVPALTADGGGTPEQSEPLVVMPSVRNLLVQVTEELLQTPDGATFLALYQRHQHEVQTLVHHNRRVLIAWHRNEGPALLRELRRFVEARTLRLPSTIKGKLVRQCLDNILAALQAAGSPQLVSDIQRYTPDLFPLLDMSYAGALSTLSAQGGA